MSSKPVAGHGRPPQAMPADTPSLPPAPNDHHAAVAYWSQRLGRPDIPVLPATVAALEVAREQQDDIDARALNEIIAVDPLMTLKLLRHTSTLSRERRNADAETVKEALVYMGIAPFFRSFGPQLSVEDHLASQPAAWQGLQRVLRRASRAATFALGFAIHRGDYDAAVVHEAALLHDFADMLLWVHAPEVAQAMAERQIADPTLRSADAQLAMLHCTLADVQHALMLEWRLPALLTQITDDRAAGLVQVRNVLLALRLARHSSEGWSNAAIPDDFADIARLLNLDLAHAEQLAHNLDSD